jgi:hypothetical protein
LGVFIVRGREVLAEVSVGLLFVAGCSSIQENDDIGNCEDTNSVPIVATYRGDEGYQETRDPYVLEDALEARAQEIQEEDTEGWNGPLRNQVIGLGEVVCRAEDGTHHLTVKGAEISSSLAENERSSS